MYINMASAPSCSESTAGPLLTFGITISPLSMTAFLASGGPGAATVARRARA